MNYQATSVYSVEEQPVDKSPDAQTIEIWADIIKPAAEPEFAEECEHKLAKIITTLPINQQNLQLLINTFEPGYKLMNWALSRDRCKIMPHLPVTLTSHYFQPLLPGNLLHISLKVLTGPTNINHRCI